MVELFEERRAWLCPWGIEMKLGAQNELGDGQQASDKAATCVCEILDAGQMQIQGKEGLGR